MDKTEQFRKKCDRDLIPDFEVQKVQKFHFPLPHKRRIRSYLTNKKSPVLWTPKWQNETVHDLTEFSNLSFFKN